MCYRTVVVLSNDQASTWENDPKLGAKIAEAMNFASGTMNEDDKRNAHFGYGRVVECAHANLNTLAMLNNYGMTTLGHGSWRSGQEHEAARPEPHKSAADRLGFTLTKKRVPKAKTVKRVLAQVNGS